MADTYSESKGLATDALEIYSRFKKFTAKEMDKTVKAALSAGARVIQKQAKSNLKQQLPNSTKRNVIKYKDTLVDAVRTSIYKKKGNTPDESKVHVMGTREQYSGTFRARFFEKGTDDRYRTDPRTGKKVFTGRIGANEGSSKAKWFFKKAVLSTKDEVIRVIDETLTKKINEINEMKF